MISISIFSIFSTNTPGPFLGILISFSQRERETVKEREREKEKRESLYFHQNLISLPNIAAAINNTMYSQSYNI